MKLRALLGIGASAIGVACGAFGIGAEEETSGGVPPLGDGASLAAGELAVGLDGVSSVALDGSHLYFATGGRAGTVGRCPRSGCAPGSVVTLASGEDDPSAVAAADGFVTWIAGARMRAVLRDGAEGGLGPYACGASVVAGALAVVGSTAFFSDHLGQSCAISEPASCAAGCWSFGTATAIASDGKFLYRAVLANEGTDIRKSTLNYDAMASLGPIAGEVVALAVDDVYVYAVTGGVDGAVHALPKAASGGSPPAPKVLASGLAGPMAAVADGSAVYVTLAVTGELARIAVADGQRSTVASGLALPKGLVDDGRSLIVAESGAGRILRVDKPR